VWQAQGEYVYQECDSGSCTVGYIRGDLEIEYFKDADYNGNAREEALLRFANLGYEGDAKATLTLLIDGRDHWDTNQADAIEADLLPIRVAAKKAKEQRLAEEREAAANAALAKAKRIADRMRREKEQQFEVLRQELGK
jgi:hypothetical protein